MKNKVSQVFDSKNFYVTIIGMVLLALEGNNILVSQSADEIYNIFESNEGFELISILTVFFANPLFKLVSKIIAKEFSFDFFFSSNFQTQIVTFLTVLVTAFIGNDELLAGIAVSLIINVVNLISHLVKNKKDA